jgi:hypothetical protein
LLLTFAVEIGDLVVAADPDKISSENMSWQPHDACDWGLAGIAVFFFGTPLGNFWWIGVSQNTVSLDLLNHPPKLPNMGGIPHFRTDPTSYGCLCMLMSYPITSLLIQAKNPFCWCLTPIISLFYPCCPCRNQRKWGKIARQGLNPIIYI